MSAQPNVSSANSMISRAVHFGAADRGVSVSSKCAGKNSHSSFSRLGGSSWSRTSQTCFQIRTYLLKNS